ncbi:nucleotidyltransferase family protein [Paenibacillus algorifonticola]|uniref:nucleotidyltransferase family protein n=1 Tax=Paenibacillus algorifonticola TaxID=684063 RepID=UPI003D2E0D41
MRMKAIILAAGYATRLYPLTKDFPKPLLEVGGRAIMDHIMEKIERVSLIDEIFIVTNARFYSQFVDWASQSDYLKPIKVIDDWTTSNENRLGAIADLQFVLEQAKLGDELLVMAGDNLFDFELADMVRFYQRASTDTIAAHEIEDIDFLRRTGVIQIDAKGRVIDFEEKPSQPKSKLACPPFYIYQQSTLPLIKQYLAEGNNPDAPGNFVPWLIRHKEVHAYKFEGKRFDIGTLESYQEARELFAR